MSWPSPASMRSPGGSPGLGDRGAGGGDGDGQEGVEAEWGVACSEQGEGRGDGVGQSLCGGQGCDGEGWEEARGRDAEDEAREGGPQRRMQEVVGRRRELPHDTVASTAHAGLVVGADARTGDRIEAEDTQDRPSSSRSEKAKNGGKKEKRPKVRRSRNNSIFVTKEVKLETCDVARSGSLGS